MRLNPRDVTGITAVSMCSSASWFSRIFFAISLTISPSSAAVPQTAGEESNAAEKLVVARATAGKIADLTKEKDRKLSAHFLEALLTGALPDFKPHRNGVQIVGAVIDEPISLRNAQISFPVWLLRCQFNNSVTFEHATFADAVSFSWSAFKAFAQFIQMKVGGDAVFSSAVFEEPAVFARINIAGDFKAQAAKFRDKEKAATFNGMKVGGDARFDRTVFEGSADFSAADIDGNFEATEVHFNNQKEGAFFKDMKVRGDRAFFYAAVFEGPVYFGGADIAHDFSMLKASFNNEKETANFFRMKVGGDAIFNLTVFDGPVFFSEVSIANNFQVGAKFNNQKNEAYFYRMKVAGYTFFDGTFQGPVDLSQANFGSLDVSHAAWPKVRMQGMSYDYISAAQAEPDSHKKLLAVVNQSAYSGDVYRRLEEFFARQGYRADADEAFIAGKRREREELEPKPRESVLAYFRSGRWLRWLGSLTLDLLVGYGRRPWQAGIPCAVLVALGCVLFSPKKKEPRNPAEAPRVYSRFWYSLGLFLPFVDLQADKVWKPKADQTFLRSYMRVHILLGWILIPIVLAALTGLIK